VWRWPNKGEWYQFWPLHNTNLLIQKTCGVNQHISASKENAKWQPDVLNQSQMAEKRRGQPREHIETVTYKYFNYIHHFFNTILRND
jgi:hypothetical protein